MMHGLSICARHKHVANDFNILNMASMYGKRLKYLRNAISMLEMA